MAYVRNPDTQPGKKNQSNIEALEDQHGYFNPTSNTVSMDKILGSEKSLGLEKDNFSGHTDGPPFDFSITLGDTDDGDVSITIDDTNNGTYRYTTDGSTPTKNHGEIYRGSAFWVNEAFTLKVIGYKNGFANTIKTQELVTIDDVMSDSLAWLKADSLSLSNDAVVASWTDSSGHNHPLLQSSASLKPVYKTNILNGKAVVRFDGTNDFLQATIAADAHNYSVFVVMKRDVSSVGNFAISASWGSGQVNGTMWMGYNNGDDFFTPASDSLHDLPSATSGDNAWHIAECIHSGNTIYGYDTGVSTGSSSSSSASRGNVFSLGGYTASGSLPFKGDIAEVIIFNSGLNSTRRGLVEQYLIEKYDL